MTEILVHYSAKKLGKVLSAEQTPGLKPKGLWVSVDDGYGWREWCKRENYRVNGFAFANRIHLATDANILRLAGAEDIDNFNQEYEGPWVGMWVEAPKTIYWNIVAQRYQGIIIAPYCWPRRLDLLWYYGWDCASGCLWDPGCVDRIKTRKVK